MLNAMDAKRGFSKSLMTAALFVTLTLGAVGARAHETVDYERMIEEKSPALVTVKFVLKIKSQWGDHEAEQEATGVLIAADGLVMCSNSHFGGGGWLAGSGATAVPTDIKILIGEDVEGLEASVVARDSDLDLAWVKLKEPSEKKLPFIDFEKSVKPKVGEKLYMVNRLPKFFDRAPMVMETQMGGFTSKPRPLYIPVGGGGATGLPVYNQKGDVVGVSVMQSPGEEEMEASGGYMGGSVVILPAEKAHKATQRALATAAEEAEEAPAATEEGEAKPATEGEESNE